MNQFKSQLLLKLKEVNDTNQHFCELKQCQKNHWTKNESCEPTPK